MVPLHRSLPPPVLVLIGLLFVSPRLIHAQDTLFLPSYEEHPELYDMLQDSSIVFLASDGDTLPKGSVSPSYSYVILYDSICATMYMLAEWKRNGKLLYLPKWKDGRRVTAHQDLLSFNSQTDTFTCRTGDTLSFYRELEWRDPRTSRQDTNNYYALDSLNYSIELVRLEDSTRLALLDSIGIRANPTMGRPRIHGVQPILGLITYKVPPAFDGVKAFMRVRLYHYGSGAYYFTRMDDFVMGISRKLTDSSWQWYIAMFGAGGSFYKTRDLENLRTVKNSSLRLDVRRVTGSSNIVSITFSSPANGGPTAIAIYDVAGRSLFYPHMTPGSSGLSTVQYTFPGSGTYFAGLLHNGQLVKTEKITITK